MFTPADDRYRAWQLTGVGFRKLKPVRLPRPKIRPDELLLHQRVTTICYSSVKVLLLGSRHPRLAGRDFQSQPVILGDECYGVVAEVGEDLRGRFEVGDRIAVSPDLDVDAFGYGVPGGQQQLNVIRGKMLDFLMKVPAEAVSRHGMFAAALSEPLGCVERGLWLEYRTAPRPDGKTFIWADARADRFTIGEVKDFPSEVVLHEEGGRSEAVRAELARQNVRIEDAGKRLLDAEAPQFDDVVVVSTRAEVITKAVGWGLKRLARFGVLAVLGDVPAGCRVKVDLGQVHYARTLVVGSDRAELCDALSRNTALGLRRGCSVLLVGAGGPMGQFFLMRCVGEKEQRPARVLAAEIRDDRVGNLRKMISRLRTDIDVSVVDVSKEPTRVNPDVRGIDYLVLLCGDVEALARWLAALNDGAVVNVFAGINGASLDLEVRDICSRGIRVIGHSGTNLHFQTRTLSRITSGEVDVAPVVAAVGGFDAVRDALKAAYEGTYPGKIVIYLDVDFPLTAVDSLTGGRPWSAEEERGFLKGKACRSKRRL